MKLLKSIVLVIALIFISGGNKEEPRFSSSQIQDALFEMNGTYYGDMRVSFCHGDRIYLASRLREIKIVQVKAGYDFYQMDDTMYHFVLPPSDVVVAGGSEAP